MISRILSAMIAIAYVTIAYFAGGNEAVLKLGTFLILPLACIWFSGEMGSFTGGGNPDRDGDSSRGDTPQAPPDQAIA